jgi:hypothetical protein
MTGKPIKPAALLILGVIVTLPSSGEALNPGDTDQGTPHAPGQQAPSNETDPSISGNAIAGETLSASVGEWSGPNVTYAFQWQRCDAGGGACGPAGPGDESFRLDESDVGSTIRVSVVATNKNGSSSATSQATAAVAPPPAPAPVLAPTVTQPETPKSPKKAPATTTTATTTTTTTAPTDTTGTPAPVTGSPSLFVAPGGSDANACLQTAPCLSFARAYALAGPGAVVQVATGSYGVQTMSVNNGGVSASQPVVFQPPAGAGAGQVNVQQLNLTGAGNLTFKTMTFGSGAAGNRAWYQRYSSNTLCDGCLIHGQLAIDGDGSNMTWQNGEIGSYIANNADPQIGAMRGPTVTNAVQPSNVSFLNESFHDVDANTTTSHTECLQVLAVHGLTIKRSKFYRCNVDGNGSKAGIMFSGYDCKGTATTLAGKDTNCGTNDDYWNITIENSMFNAGLSPAEGGNYFAFQWDDQFADPIDCKNILIRNNSIIGGLLWGCNLNPAANTQAIANIISYSGGFWSSQCNAVFLYNIWETGPGCPGTNSHFGTVTYLNRANTAGFDLHLQTGSLGIGLGDPTNLPDTDYDGQPRPQGTVDTGADERLS